MAWYKKSGQDSYDMPLASNVFGDWTDNNEFKSKLFLWWNWYEHWWSNCDDDVVAGIDNGCDGLLTLNRNRDEFSEFFINFSSFTSNWGQVILGYECTL